jgi:methylase of polypeptide subunit release factors
LILELGHGQAEVVRDMIRRVGAFDDVACREDAAGIQRVLIAKRVA